MQRFGVFLIIENFHLYIVLRIIFLNCEVCNMVLFLFFKNVLLKCLYVGFINYNCLSFGQCTFGSYVP
jgi:hypothetical protein